MEQIAPTQQPPQMTPPRRAAEGNLADGERFNGLLAFPHPAARVQNLHVQYVIVTFLSCSAPAVYFWADCN